MMFVGHSISIIKYLPFSAVVNRYTELTACAHVTAVKLADTPIATDDCFVIMSPPNKLQAISIRNDKSRRYYREKPEKLDSIMMILVSVYRDLFPKTYDFALFVTL